MTGMTTDTNNFANSVFPGTMRMASELIAAGVDRDLILSDLYHNYRENRLRLMGYLLSENLVISPEGAAVMVLDKECQERFDFRQGESEGFVNLPIRGQCEDQHIPHRGGREVQGVGQIKAWHIRQQIGHELFPWRRP